MNRKAGKQKSKIAIFLIGLYWVPTACAAIPLSDPNSPVKSEVLRREIMASQIQPLYLSITSVTETDLDALIGSLSRLEVPVPESSGSPSPAVSSEPSVPVFHEPLQEACPPPVSVEESVPPQRPSEDSEQEAAGPKWLAWIDSVEQPVDPMALGDVLFQMGQLERAERFYRRVLEQTTLPEDSDWQWAQYQRANCLRRTHPSEARKLYQELLTKAPGSSWTGAAGAQQATLTWYETIQASKMKRYLSDPNSIP